MKNKEDFLQMRLQKWYFSSFKNAKQNDKTKN